MRLSRLIVASMFAGSTFVWGSSTVAFADATGPAIRVAATSQPITLTTSNWKFAPAEITVRVNQSVTLRLTSAEGVHGIQSSDLGIPQTLIEPGSSKTVTFRPTKPGTYTVHCSMFCGQGHGDMTLVIRVIS